MQTFNSPAIQSDRHDCFSGQLLAQSSYDFGQSDHSNRLHLRKIPNAPWQFISINISFAIRVISNFLLSHWERRSSWSKAEDVDE